MEVVLHVDRHRVDARRLGSGRRHVTAPPLRISDRLHRLRDDEQVERKRHVLDVEQVVLQLLHRVFDAGAVGVADLRPAGQPGTHRVALAVERDLHASATTRTPAAPAAGRRGSCRPRSTFHSCGSSSRRVRRRKLPDGVTRSSFLLRPHRAGVLLRVRAHRAELVHREHAPVHARRAPGDRATGPVDVSLIAARPTSSMSGAATSSSPRRRAPRSSAALRDVLQRLFLNPSREDQPARTQVLDRDLAGVVLVNRGEVIEADAVELHLEQLVHRQLAAGVRQADDHLVDAAGRGRSRGCLRSCR